MIKLQKKQDLSKFVCVCVCVGPPHFCTRLNRVCPSIFRLEKRKQAHKRKRGKINSYTAKVLSMKGPTLSFQPVRSVSFPSFFLFWLIWKWDSKAAAASVYVSVCISPWRSILELNVVALPGARGALQRVRQPVVMTLYGKMAQREQSHLHWHFCHHLWLCQQAGSPAPPPPLSPAADGSHHNGG